MIAMVLPHVVTIALLLLAALLALRTTAAASDRDGPFGVETDCAVRGLLLKHALHIQPALSGPNLHHVFDSLELAARCNASRPIPPAPPPPPAATPSVALFVDFARGDDSAAGTVSSPLKTVAKALAAAGVRKPVGAIVLRAGVHFLESTLQLTPAHSDLLITAYCSGSAPCEEVWLSGGIPLPTATWKPHNISGGANIWQRQVPTAAAAAGAVAASALHWLDDLEGATALTRARWPNRRPQDGTIDKPSLLDISPSSAVWLQPPNVRPAQHKAVTQPSIPLTVTGEFNQWMVGVGGECDRFSPPAAAICNPNATGGGYNWDGPGPFFPTGLQLGNASGTLFPNSPQWRDLSQALFTSWTNGWFTSHFDIATGGANAADGSSSPSSFDGDLLTFGPHGGTQGGRGWHFPGGSRGDKGGDEVDERGGFQICTGDVRASDCGPVKIEGVFAELDAADEFYFDRSSSTLFLFYNSSSTISGATGEHEQEWSNINGNSSSSVSGDEQCTAASCKACACGSCNSCPCGQYCYAYCAKNNCGCPACNGPNPSPPTPAPHNKPVPPPQTRTLVVPHLKQLLVIQGTHHALAGGAASAPPTVPVRNITIRGLGFRDGAPTVLEPHGIPSGGGIISLPCIYGTCTHATAHALHTPPT